MVQILAEGGHVVGTTGDGVNDAPALMKANIGIAVANATQAARAAADIVLTRAGKRICDRWIRSACMLCLFGLLRLPSPPMAAN